MAKKTETKNNIRIIVGQRGWVHVGRVDSESDTEVVLSNARCIRRWGTPGQGLAFLAANGPQAATQLDAAAPVYRIHPLAIVHQYDCDPAKWDGKL